MVNTYGVRVQGVIAWAVFIALALFTAYSQLTRPVVYIPKRPLPHSICKFYVRQNWPSVKEPEYWAAMDACVYGLDYAREEERNAVRSVHD